MHIIDVTVREKVAMARGDQYVCGNTDYIARFDFDSEWDEYETKTARFVMQGGKYIDVVFTGTDCPVPKMVNISYFNIGAFAGDLHTTTPAMVKSQKSILCGSGSPTEPAPDVYAQIMELLNKGGGGSGGMGGADWNAKEGEPGHVLNRTHYTESSSVEVPLHIEFDGNASGKETALVEGVTFVKVSNTVLTKDELVGATVLISAGGEEISIVLNAEDGSMQDMTADGIPLIANFEAFIALQSDYTFEGSEFTAGLYFVSMDGVYTKSLSNPNVTVTEETETVHKLDPKYLPDGVPCVIKGGMVEILPETQAVMADSDGSTFAILENVPVLLVGESYIINYNGVEYTCVGQDMSRMLPGAVGLGDLTISELSGNGEPFAIVVADEGSGLAMMIMPFDGATSVTLSIYGNDVEIRKLDNRCPPDGMPKLYNVHFTMNVSNGNYIITPEQTFAEVYANASDHNTITRGIVEMLGNYFFFTLSGCGTASMADGSTQKEVTFTNAEINGSKSYVMRITMYESGDTIISEST